MKISLISLDKAQIEKEIPGDVAPDIIIFEDGYYIYDDYNITEEMYYFNQVEPDSILHIKE